MAPGYWPDDYQDKRRAAEEAIRLIKRGQRIFIGSACGEPQALVRELARQSCHFTDLEIVRTLSLESTSLTLIADQTAGQAFTVRSFYLGSAKPKDLAQGKRFLTPINLSAVPRLFRSRRLPIHVALIQLSPPDDFGWMSLGISVDVTMAAAKSADLVIAQINPNMPRVMGRSFLHVDDVDVVVEAEEPLLTIRPAPEFESAHLIARHVARLIDDGSTLQMSLGATPQATLLALSDKNDLGIHTQFLSEGIMRLVAMGVVTNRKKGFNKGKLVASGAVGGNLLYEYLHDNPSIEFYPSDYVNDPDIIARHNKMVSLNVAMAMDLTGQVAADALPYNNYSGVNGLMDFIRGAAQSPGGKSVLMLPSTTLDGQASRIVPSLGDIPIVVPRADVHYVVTEFGSVNLFGKNYQERALALISIAHPKFRDELFVRAKEAGLIGAERSVAESPHGVYPLKIEEVREIKGQRILFRPAKPVDERLIQEHFYGLDRKDVTFRFLHEKTSFLRKDVANVFEVDYLHNMTLVAVIGEMGFERVVGLATYYVDAAKNMAEVAYSTASDWQKRGIGTVLQEKLVDWARENGLAGIIALVSPQNQNMIKLFKKLPYQVSTRFEDDLLVLSCRFDEPRDKEACR